MKLSSIFTRVSIVISGITVLLGLIMGYILKEYKVKLIDEMILEIGILVLITYLILIGLLFVYLYKYIFRPLTFFVEASEEISKRNYSYRLEFNAKHEFKDLKDAFNHMAEEIEEYAEELNLERRRAEEVITSKMQFFANMSHEIRTPLNSIIGFSELLEEEEKDKNKKSRLSVVTKSGKHLMTIINDILDISKFELSELSLEMKSFSLPELLLDLNKTYQPLAESKKLRFKIDFKNNRNLHLIGDVHRLKQILNNLISNAFKFTNTGSIRVNVEYENGFLFISVADTGIGISLENQTGIFDAFAQSDMSTTRLYGGTGLGLAICRKLVDKMDGMISLESQFEVGSKFHVSIPLDRDLDLYGDNYEDLVMKWQMNDIEASDLLESVIQGIPDRIYKVKYQIMSDDIQRLKEEIHAFKGIVGNFGIHEIYEVLNEFDIHLKNHCVINSGIFNFVERLDSIVEKIPDKYFDLLVQKSQLPSDLIGDIKILIGEDIPENTMLIRQILLNLNVNILEADNGEKVLELLEYGDFDILLLDMHMPVLDGIEVLKKIRIQSKFEKLWIVAITASAQIDEINMYYELGCNNVISKPVDKDLLRNQVLEIIRKKR